MAKRGRPSKLTPALAKVILADVEAGLTPEVAAQCAGIDRTTFFRWMAAAKEGRPPFATFATEVARARAVCEKTLLTTALAGDSAGKSFGPGRAALEMAGRLFPDRYSPTHRIQLRDALERIFKALEREIERRAGQPIGPELYFGVVESLTHEDDGAEEMPALLADKVH